MNADRLRERVVQAAQNLERQGILGTTAGNVSARGGELVAITPSGLSYVEMEPADVVVVDMEGRIIRGARRPSSELPFHLAVYGVRPDVAGVVHTHSAYATTLAVMRRPIPAVHYAIADFGVSEIPVVPYETFGSDELAAELERTATSGAQGALLANHGCVAFGQSVEQAATRATVLEFLAMLFYRTLCAGDAFVLADVEIARVAALYRSYGQPADAGERLNARLIGAT